MELVFEKAEEEVAVSVSHRPLEPDKMTQDINGEFQKFSRERARERYYIIFVWQV